MCNIGKMKDMAEWLRAEVIMREFQIDWQGKTININRITALPKKKEILLTNYFFLYLFFQIL